MSAAVRADSRTSAVAMLPHAHIGWVGRNPRLRVAVARLAALSDWLAAAAAIALPWSTSATSILIVLWLLAAIPSLDARSARRAFSSWAGVLPVLLWTLGAVGMLWSDVSVSERLAGLSGYHK